MAELGFVGDGKASRQLYVSGSPVLARVAPTRRRPRRSAAPCPFFAMWRASASTRASPATPPRAWANPRSRPFDDRARRPWRVATRWGSTRAVTGAGFVCAHRRALGANNWRLSPGGRASRSRVVGLYNGPLADVRSGARAVCPGLVLTRSGPRRAPSGEWRPAGRASGPAPVGGPVRRRAPVRPRPGPSGCVRPRPGPDLPSGAPSGTGLVASMLASARRRAPSGAKFPRPEVSVGRPSGGVGRTERRVGGPYI